MRDWIEAVPLKKIFDLLPDEFKQKITEDSLKELEESKRKSFVRKRFYKLRTKKHQFIHISCGKALRSTFENSLSLNKILPKITCKPLFIKESEKFSLFAQEYFEGQPVDEAYEKGIISENGLIRILTKIKRELYKIEKPSTRNDFEEELEKLKISVLENDRLFEFDKHYLELVVFPFIEHNLQGLTFSTRISNGDLAARNILVDENENFKIIDAEFAKETHFHQEDWVRLAKFSGKGFAESDFLQSQLKSIDQVFELILNLRQTVLNRSVDTEENYINHTTRDLYNCLWGSKFFKDCKKQNLSLIIEGVRNNIHNSEKELDIKKEATNLLQSQLDKQKNATQILQSQLKHEKDDNSLLQSQLNQEKDDNSLLQSQLKKVKNDNNLLQNSLEGETKAKLQVEQNLESEKNSRLLLQTESIQQKDKILRMQKSISWRITSPIRFLRRKFLEPSINSVCTNPKYENEGKSYQDWINKYDTISDDRIASFKKDYEDLTEKPLFSIIMPVYDPPEQFFEDALRSVVSQVYTNWELCIADDHSTQAYVHEIIKKYSKKFPKIKVHINEKHSHISETSNNALKLAEGEFIVLMDHDDLLRPHSLLRIAQAIFTNRKLKFIYSDEDKITYTGLRTEPYFKPDWNPELLLSQNYLCHLTCIKKNLVNKIGAFRVGYEGSQDWDLFLRATEALSDNEIYHITEVLYHWRTHTNSTASSLVHKKYCYDSSEKAVSSHFKRRGIQASLSPLNQSVNYWRINYKIPKNKPLVSIIIPTKNYHKILNKCISSILSKTDYNKYEIIIVDNGTDEDNSVEYLRSLSKYNNIKVIKCDGDFNFSKLNNNAAKNAKGEILVLLNNDIEVIKGDWLSILVSHAIRKEVGCVGAKLIYPNNTIQHAGVILGLGGVAGHPYKGFPSGHLGYFSRLMITQNVEAVTGACLAVRKTIFNEVGGLNENDLKVAFNDVDFCLKVSRSGYRNIMDPNVLLFHHESLSRGLDTKGEKKLRFQKEANYMLKKWGQRLLNDSNYNPNLTLKHENFGLSFPPRLKVSR